MPSTSTSISTQTSLLPLGLKLPTIALSSPTTRSPTSPPSPPENPCPWLWRCHSCLTIYRLAVTRRCLECDHQFCLGTPAPSTNDPKGKKRKRSRGGPCRAEFDYAGWSIYNSWRRTVLLNPSSSPPSFPSPSENNNKYNNKETWGNEYAATEAADNSAQQPFTDRRDGLFVRKRHDCWVHCDFPSECHHAVYRAQQEGRPILTEAEALDAVNKAAAAAGAGERGLDKNISGGVGQYKRAKSTVDRGVGLSKGNEEKGEKVDLSGDKGDDGEGVSLCSPEPPRDSRSEPEVSPVTPFRGAEGHSTNLSKGIEPEVVWKDIDVGGASTKATPLEFEIYTDDTQTSPDATTHPVEKHHDSELDGFSAEGYHNGPEAAKIQSKCTAAAAAAAAAAQPPAPLQLTSFASFADSHNRRGGGSNIGLDAEEGQPTTIEEELESAYSEKAWFTTTEGIDGRSGEDHPATHGGLERRCRKDEMLALLERRTIPTTHSGGTTGCATTQEQLVETGEDWESRSDSSSISSSSSSPCSVSSLFSISSRPDDETDAEGSGKKIRGGDDLSVAVVNMVGDSSMPQVLPRTPINEDADMSPVTPVKKDGEGSESDLMV